MVNYVKRFSNFSINESKIPKFTDEYLSSLRQSIFDRFTSKRNVRFSGDMLEFLDAPSGDLGIRIFPPIVDDRDLNARIQIHTSLIDDFGFIYLADHAAKDLCLDLSDKLVGNIEQDTNTMLNVIKQVTDIMLVPKNYFGAIRKLFETVDPTVSDVLPGGYNLEYYDLYKELIKSGLSIDRIFNSEEEHKKYIEDSRSVKSKSLFGI